MPRLSVWALRLALLYLALGFTFGAVLLINKGLGLWPWAWGLLVPHMEFLLLGWTVQLAFGMAYWMLPRYPGGGRGAASLAVAALALLNLGVLLVAFTPLLKLPAIAVLVGRVLQALAAALFGYYVWGRVRPTYPGDR